MATLQRAQFCTSNEIPRATTDTRYSEITASAQAQGLLAALVGYLQPIIQTCVASAGHPNSKHIRGGRDEGHKLLEAIDDFIVMSVHLDSPVQSPNDINIEVGSIERTVESETDSVPLIASPLVPIPHESIQSGIIKVLRPHISNKMPIRVLAFDSAGAGMKLIDRNEMFRRVLHSAFIGASQPDFQIAWMEAEELANSPPLGWQEAGRRHNKLITELVEYHARYAILSHTWIRDTPGDVVFKDWEIRESNPRGYSKIAKFCEVAARDHGVAFGWMDSICINKDSSSELDESIRSMYKWYRAAYVCITYLAETRLLEDMQRDSWFTRGWTLQELLAPQSTRFYDMDWDDLLIERDDPLDLPFFPLPRTEAEINEKIRERTSITEDELTLCRCGDAEKIPISRRLELASQ
ncbi:hypothetical protein HYPSUDRAFT_634491 [Hypholoma sublateritium FD-334 SS-4]|uniref:Heterokaryon incompatibility domain-containing protein n=1 Tax=Hypholoma sublateritium (strain FD-334 SS-4) TaxID=945553 RepID=A0A0D2LM36_HYPSF|nr:hypothetical protein HYPSUDRAFT_634491 [Hypholoma sublateritium FD-334 SS-4]